MKLSELIRRKLPALLLAALPLQAPLLTTPVTSVVATPVIAALAVTAAALTLLAPQPAEAAALSNYLQNKYIDWLFRGQAYTVPTTQYVGLDTTAGTAAACGTEVSGGSYARVAITSSLTSWAGTQGVGTTAVSNGTSGQTSNNGAITFPAPTANWGTVVGFCVWDASTGGNLLYYGPLTVNQTITSGAAAPSFAAAAFTYTIQ
jgi:hypothetical protein